MPAASYFPGIEAASKSNKAVSSRFRGDSPVSREMTLPQRTIFDLNRREVRLEYALWQAPSQRASTR